MLSMEPDATQSNKDRKDFIGKINAIAWLQFFVHFLLSFLWRFTGLPSWLAHFNSTFLVFILTIVLIASRTLASKYPVNYIFLAFYTILTSLEADNFIYFSENIKPNFAFLIAFACTLLAFLISFCLSMTKFDLTGYGAAILCLNVILYFIASICSIFITPLFIERGSLTIFILFLCLLILLIISLMFSFAHLYQRFYGRHKKSYELTEEVRAIFLLSVNINIFYRTAVFLIYLAVIINFLSK